jgi:hypothetical protein
MSGKYYGEYYENSNSEIGGYDNIGVLFGILFLAFPFVLVIIDIRNI